MNKSPICYIEDVRNYIIYLLKGISCELWDLIITNKDYNKINEYVLKNHLENEFREFLQELKYRQIIQIEDIEPKSTKKYINIAISKKDENYQYFKNIFNEIYTKNEFLICLYLALNYKCNLNCKHCYNPKNMPDCEINFETAKKIIDEAYEFNNYKVMLSGGECTVNKDFLKIAKYIREKYLNLYILTNGQKLYDDENLFNELIKIYPSLIQISLYSMDSKIHDMITGIEGSHYKTVKVIKKLKESGMNVQIACFDMSYNEGEYKEVKKFADSLNIDFVKSHIFINNKQNNNLESKIREDNITEFYIEYFENISRKKFEKTDELICPAGVERLYIDPALNIMPCVYYKHILGNYKTTSLKDIKNKIIPEFYKTFKRNDLKECFKYDYCEYCDYCPIYANEEGSVGKSDVLCEDARAYQKAVLYHQNLNNYNVADSDGTR